MNTQITAGTRVEFNSAHGAQTGTVNNFTRDIGNGQRFALVEIDHALPGILWNVPLDSLRLMAASSA